MRGRYIIKAWDYCWCGQVARFEVVARKGGDVYTVVCSQAHGEIAVGWATRGDDGEQLTLVEDDG